METSDQGTLIVGAGQAGYALAAALREMGDERVITLVGDEAIAPYERPPLSKGYLQGLRDIESTILGDLAWYDAQGVELVTGESVTQIDRDAEGGSATTASGRTFAFSRLALATGSVNRRLDVPDADLAGVLSLRDVVDAQRLRAALGAAHRVTIVGGGFIGLEVAAAARSLGKEVTVLEAADRLLGRAVSPQLSAFYAAAHDRRGTRVLLGATVTRIHSTDGSAADGVALASGEVIAADLVVVAVGAVPRTELAAQLGLTVDNGIVVDEHALSSDRITVAVGDCTNLPNPFVRGGAGRVRLESAQHATDHPRSAAAALLSRPMAYTTVPWFWSDQADLKLQIVGLVDGHDDTVLRGDVDTEHFSLLHYRDGLLVAAECVGTPSDHLAVKHGLAKGMTIGPRTAGDTSIPLKRLLTPPPSRQPSALAE